MNCEYCAQSEHQGINCDRFALKERVKTLMRSVQLKDMELQASKKLEGKGIVFISSLISHRTQKPRIDIQVGEVHTQVDVDAAMDIAKNIIECAQGAYADGFIFHFLTEKLGQSESVGAQIIQDFRIYRDALRVEFEEMNQGGANDSQSD